MAPPNGSIISSETQGKKPLFSFGVIADVQYADVPDGRSFHGVPRYYRHSINVLQRAVSAWNRNSSHARIDFVLNFGDIVDGRCPKDESLAAVQKVVAEFDKFDGPVYHMIGNHCLYNLPREHLIPLLGIPSRRAHYAYFDFSPAPGCFRIVVLDPYDISAIGWPENHRKTHLAAAFLRSKNPNADKNRTDGLPGLERRFVEFNGAFGRKQLEWLDNVLRCSAGRGQSVVVCCHLPLHPIAASPEALPWNYDEALDVIHRYSCVRACFSGHDHRGGYAVDSHGVHHRVLEAALECPRGSDSFGRVDVYPNKLILFGVDRMPSTEMVFSCSQVE